jgi:hypothetical protein
MSYTPFAYIVNSSSAQGTTDFQFTFPYIEESHIQVFLNYAEITQGSGGAQYQVITNVSPKLIRLNTGITSANLRVEIRRNSSLATPLVDYADGSTLTANDLDTSALQSLYIDQELKDNQSKTVSVNETTGLPTLNSQRLTNVADPTAAQDAATKNYIDTKQFTSSQIQDGTLVNADVNASAAIAGTKISPNFGSQNIVTSGTVDGRDVSNDGIKLDSIETGATADQTNAEIRAAVEAASDSNVFTDADHSKLNAIEASATADQTNAEIRTAVEAATDSNVFTDADHSKLNAIEASATADQTNAEIRTAVEAATDSNVFTDADHSKLNAIEASATADQTASEIKTLLQSDKLTSSEIATGALDGRYYTETESDARYFNISTGDTIKDGDTFPDNDTTIATTAAINDRIIDLVDDVGGFVPIANETSFPNANPDVNNGAGTLVSIKALSSNLTSNGSGVATISNGTVGNSTVTITGLANSTTYAANFGLIVETTSTLNTYAFHRQVPIATEVSTVAGSISNVNTVAGSISNVNTVAGNNSNINTVAGVSSNVTTVAGVASNVTTVAGISSDVTAVAGDATDIGAVAAKATEIGRLGTADAVSDLNTLGTTAIVSDLDTCATNVSNINTAAGSISNINTVATNISNVNDFSDKYRVASSAPTSSLDTGDLYFDTSANELKVYNGSAWQGGVTATGNLAGLGANTFTGNQSLGDNKKVIFGTGGDLEIYHDGSNSYIDDAGTGNLYLRGSASIEFRKAGATEKMLYAEPDAEVQLYYDNSKKLETTSYGVLISSRLNAQTISIEDWNSTHETGAIKLGTGNDLQIYHAGTYSVITNATGDLYINNSADTIIKPANDCFIKPQGGEDGIKVIGNGGVELYYDNAKKLETKSNGVEITGNCWADAFYLGDNEKSYWGTGDDLQLYHDGSNSYIDNNTGTLNILSADEIRLWVDDDEYAVKAVNNGSVELYYDGSKKFATKSNGAFVHGDANGAYLVLADTSSNYCYQLIGFDANASAAGGRLVLADADGGTVLDMRQAGNNIFCKNNFNLNVDNLKLQLGAGDDLQIYHDGTDSHIKNSTGNLYFEQAYFRVRNAANTEHLITANENGAVELYYDNSKKFETTSTGVTITGSQSKLVGDVRFDNGTNTEKDIYWDESENRLNWFDDVKATFGNSNDLQIYHDGSNSYIHDNGTGQLIVRSDGFQVRNSAATEYHIACNNNAAVELYYDNSKKLETSSTGVTVTGTVSDSKGDLRKIPINTQGSAYTLVAGDAGKFISASANITWADSVFSAGDAVTIVNNSNSNITITKGSNMYNTADGNNANRTLAARGMATILWVSASAAYISGSGLT